MAWVPLFCLGQLTFEHPIRLAESSGLPDMQVNCIGLDSTGFMWFGTVQNLIRFDGHKSRIYSQEPGNPHGLYNSLINDLLIEKERIWICHYQGFSILDLKRDIFTNYQITDSGLTTSPQAISQRIYQIHKDRQGDYWLSTGRGLTRVDKALHRVEHFPYQTKQGDILPQDKKDVNRITRFTQDHTNDSLLWAGTRSGLLKLNTFTGQVDRYYMSDPDKNRALNLNFITTGIYSHRDGWIYLSTPEHPLNRFHPQTETFEELANRGSPFDDVLFRLVRDIRAKSDHELWITTDGGLMIFDCQNKEFRPYKINREEEGIYYGVGFIDEKGRNWLKSIRGPILYDPLIQQFDRYPFRHLIPKHLKGITRDVIVPPKGESDTFHFIVEQGQGLYHLNRTQKTWSVTALPSKYASDYPSFDGQEAFQVGEQSWLILEANKGFYQYDAEEQTLLPLPQQPKHDPHFFYAGIRHSSGDYYIGNDKGGMVRYNMETGESRVFVEELEVDSPYASSRFVRFLKEDSKGHVWIKRSMGFSIYLPESDTFIHHLGTHHKERAFNHVFGFVEDEQGRMWTGTYQSAIGYAEVDHPERGLVEKIYLDKPPSVLLNMDMDQQGNLWLLSNRGLIKFDPNSRKYDFFSSDYGFSPDVNYMLKALDNGEMMISSEGEISFFQPDLLLKNEEFPIPYLTGFKVFDQPIYEDTSLVEVEDIKLSYKQNFFSFEFSAISHSLSHKNTFQYQLVGFDSQWIEAGERRFANYTNVPSGSYQFRVQAFNNEGSSNSETFTIDIHISTPWWASWWFKTLIPLILIGIALGIVRYRFRQIRREERLKAAFERKITSAELYALRSQMNPHFIFNSLNSIDYYILKNETFKASEYLNQFSRLIRLILQNSRSEFINLTNELEALKLYMDMERLRFKNRFDYRFQIDAELSVDMIEIPPMLIQPYVENAIWHGLMHKEGNGHISLHIEQTDTHLICTIEDDGIGRQKARMLASRHAGRKRKSFGMKITQDRISKIQRMHEVNASVEIIDILDSETEEGRGTKVIIHIPLHRRDG